MDLQEARSIIARHNAGDRSVSMHEHKAASIFVGSFYEHEGKHLLRPASFTADASPHVTQRADGVHIHLHDQTGNAGDLDEADPGSPSSGVHGAMRARGEVSGKTIGRLPRSAASYALVDDPTGGGCCVIEIGDNDDSIDPGAVSSGGSARMRGSGVPSSLTGDAMQRQAEFWRRRSQPSRSEALGRLAKAAGGR
jgi:hypothetical protein